jgi:hypothetical protein
LPEFGIQDWQLNMPTFKGNYAAATMTALAYMFNGQFLSHAQDVFWQ